VALSNWRATNSSAVNANFVLQKAAIGALLKEVGTSAPVDGLASASGTVKGTLGSPQAAFQLNVEKPRLEGRQFDRFAGAVQLTDKSVDVSGGNLTLSGATATFSGGFTRTAENWKSGQVRFQVSGSSIPLSVFRSLGENLPGVEGSLSIRGQGTAEVKEGEFLLRSLNGAAFSRTLTVLGKPLGRVSLDANSNGRDLKANATVQMRDSKMSGTAQVDLAGDYPVKGSVQIEALSLTTLQDLSGYVQNGKERPFTGSLEGNFQFAGPARIPAKISGSGAISRFELKPRTVVDPTAKQAPIDLNLKNDGPVRIVYSEGSLRIDSAHFVTKDTNLAVDGSFSPEAKSPLDLRFKGALNLAVLQSFSTDLRVSGLSVMDASLRGTPMRPILSGKLELKNASVFMADVPNGIDNANGTLVFDQNRVLIQEIKAQSGGGDLALRGLVSVGGKDLTFRIQGTATNVRVRYPEGVSTTLNADLSFTGTQNKSLVSGTATVVRSGLNAKTEFGSLFAASAKPAAEPVTTSDFLRGMQLDVNLNTGPSFQLATSYTKNMQTEARLQVHGTAAKPSVLGRITVSEGDIDFFGSTYKVVRGEINFYNPAAIEPVIDADLETRVRAITVNIKLSGPLSRLNISYRSDPPLSSAEIFALLTAGRSPDMGQVTGTAVATPGDVSGGSAGTALLGQVLSSSVSGRLQKFFGVSRLKIDPRAVGLDGTPQAQLTVEQQISRDVTLTYVSNLQNTQQQIVRMEWNLSKQWSAVAVRDANGLFGIDFYYRKRLK
jgi:translocation and assembly module TamB